MEEILKFKITYLITIPTCLSGRSTHTPINNCIFSCRIRQRAFTSETKECMSSELSRLDWYIQTEPCQYPLLEIEGGEEVKEGLRYVL